jgi:hypothetical protein
MANTFHCNQKVKNQILNKVKTHNPKNSKMIMDMMLRIEMELIAMWWCHLINRTLRLCKFQFWIKFFVFFLSDLSWVSPTKV